MKIIDEVIKKSDLLNCEVVFDGPMIKGVVDIEKELLGVDANMYADIEQMFLTGGSKQENLWGINLYPEDTEEDFLEFDSMINIRPIQNNRSRGVENAEIREKIKAIVEKWVK